MSGPPPLLLEEARRRLKELGYLDGRVERFLFRRAFEGRGGLFLPVVLIGALAAALASVAAVESTEAGFGASASAVTALLAHLFLANLLPAALAAALLAFLADRSRAPGGAAAAAGLATAAAVFTLWVAGVYSLARGLPARALLWGIPIAAAALLAAVSARAGFLAQAYAHSRVLPSRRRERIVLAAAALAGVAGALVLLASRREPAAVEPPRPSARPGAVVVVAVDGLAREAQGSAAGILPEAAAGWWPARAASPPEIWTNLATGEPPDRHGVRALERVRPSGSPLAVRAPFGTAWYLKRLGPALRLVSSAPVSAEDRRRLAFWEVAASAGLPTLAVGWWASGPWPGAAVAGNEEILAGARDGLEADRMAREIFRARASGGERIRTVYLPGLDILRRDPERRRRALAETLEFLREEAARARTRGDVLIVLAADSHASPGAPQSALVVDGAGRRTVRIRPEDVAPSILARAGIPVARDLPGRPAAPLFSPGTLDEETVETYGPRIAPAPAARRGSDREYLEKLKALGYLN
ncbi:MAG: hypothetical protein ACM3SU_03835 [Acidobacteriota bacterium]